MLDSQALSGWVTGWQDVAIVVLVTALVLWWGNKIFNSSEKQYPPGPPRWPIVGNLPQLKKMHADFERFTKQYGKGIICLKLGSVPLVVVSSHEYAREICRTFDSNFAYRPQDLVSCKHLFGNGRSLSFIPIGDHFKYMRKIFSTEIFIPKRLRVYKDQRQDIIVGAVNEMFELTKQGQEVNMKEHMISLMYNVVTQMVMGKTLYGTSSATSPEQDDFRNMVEEHFGLMPRFSLKDWFPFTRVFGDFQGVEREMQNNSARFQRFLQGTLDSHRKAKQEREERRLRSPVANEEDPEEKEDYVDTLLQIEGDEDHPFTDVQRKLLIQPLLTGGTEAASTVILWATLELCRHPELMKRMQDEIESVVGKDRPVQEEDIPNLPLLIAIVKETFRLHPNLPFLLPRQGQQDMKVKDYLIPKNARIFISNWGLGRDPAVWENPLEFNPDRFLGPNDPYDLNGSSFKLMPFGAGKRLCPGMNLGLVMVQLGLGNMVHLCNLTLPRGMKPEDIDPTERGGINLLPETPLMLLVTPRLAPEVYIPPTVRAAAA